MDHSKTIATMKNLFKSLMLVAVAAMAFTACQKDNAEVNQAEQTRVVKFTATIGEDDTRSGFTEKVGDAYKSAWEGGEWIYAYANSSGISNPMMNEGGKFSVNLGNFDTTISFYSPSDSWTVSSGERTPIYDKLKEQTPRANSVDPAVHLLKKENLNIEGDNIAFTMNHAVAYGKMTVNVGFKVAKVILTLNEDTTHTLYGTNVEDDNTFWFATTEATINKFTVTAYDENNNAVTKTVSDLPADGTGSLKFQTGRVSTFSVSDLKEMEIKVVSAVAGQHILTNGAVNNNDKLVLFTLSDGTNFAVAFTTNGKNYLAPGVWDSTNINYIYRNYSYVDCKVSVAISNSVEINVSYENDVYTIGKFDAYNFNTSANEVFPGYTGAIEGLNAPETGNEGGGGGGEKPEPSGTVEFTECGVTFSSGFFDLYFVNSDYKLKVECNGNVGSSSATKDIPAGEYSWSLDNWNEFMIYGCECKLNDEDVDSIGSVNITSNGDSNYTIKINNVNNSFTGAFAGKVTSGIPSTW